MDLPIPPGFDDLTTIYTAPDGSFKNIIGVVVDLRPVGVSRRGEHMLTFELFDLKLAASVAGREGVTVRYFSKDEELLPKVRNIGDVVHLRQIKTMSPNGQRMCLSHFSTRTLVFPSATIPTPGFSIGFHDKNRIEGLGNPLALQDFRNNLREQKYIIDLRHSDGIVSILEHRRARMSGNPSAGPASTVTQMPLQSVPQQPKKKYVEESGSAGQPPAKKAKQMGTFGFKFKLVEELRPQMFADLCGVVVKKAPASYGCDLYITDYTSNDMVRYYPKPEEETERERDGDAYGYTGLPKKAWPGPYEWFVLKVNLKPPHANFAIDSVSEGDHVLLRNVKSTMTRTGNPWLEGDMWQDWDHPDRIKISKLLDPNLPEIMALRHRQEKYWATRNAQLQRAGNLEAAEGKGSKKKKEKKERRRKKLEEEAAKEAEKAAELEKKNINQSVRCTHTDVPLTRMSDILDLQNKKHVNSAPDGRNYVIPFINAKYRAKVRVVAFEPKNLENFALPAEPLHDVEESPNSADWPLSHASPSYEWYFRLLLEDASQANGSEKHRVWVEVQHDSALYLLGNFPDAEDLEHNRSLLTKLQEKLFLLWGNLQEKSKEQELSNLPFECGIMEYGIPLDDDDDDDGQQSTSEKLEITGWRRMYAMFGARIF